MNRKHAGLFYLVLIYIVSLFKLNLKEKIFSSKVKSEIKKKRSYRILVSCNEKNKLTTFNRFYEILDPPEKIIGDAFIIAASTIVIYLEYHI